MTKTARIVIISVGCPNGSTHISLKKSIRPNISTGVRIRLPWLLPCGCLLPKRQVVTAGET